MKASHLLLFSWAVMWSLPACISPDPPPEFRYFDPLAGLPALPEVESEEGLGLRFRHTAAAAFLKEAMVWRSAGGEMGTFDLWRWSEKPEKYLQWELDGILFQQGPFQRIETGLGPRLRVELRAFEFIRNTGEVRVQFWAMVQASEGGTMLERLYQQTAEVPVVEPERIAEALGTALRQGVLTLRQDLLAAF
ncbi:MAG: hypothetical protein DWQ01_17640 [Planctomycetota bacterium]|nr:MAG: hypothetical protein DWQ01_17640 [Planctomycetota bacterium]